MRRSDQLGLVCVAFAWLVLVASSADAGPVTYRWGYSAGASGTDVAQCVTFDGTGNVLVTGVFDASVDFDPGEGRDIHTSSGERDVFVTKLGPDGSHVWTRTWGSVNIDWGEGIASDTDGSVMVTGRFSGAADFDPTDGLDLRVPGGNWSEPAYDNYDAFVTRLGPDGSYQWTWAVGSCGRNTSDGGFILARDPSGDWLVCGAYHQTVDFDQTAEGVDEHTAEGEEHDLFLTKLGADGSYKWTKTVGGAGVDVAWGVVVDSQQNIIMTGRFMDTVDFDPGDGEEIHTAVGENDVFVTKWDKDGNHIWTRTFGGTSTDGGWRVALDEQDAIYTAGWAIGTVDFDPTDGVDEHADNGGGDIFIHKLNADGSYGWAYTAGAAANDGVKFVTVTPEGLVIAAGFFEGTVDFDAAGTGDVRTANGGRDVCVIALRTDGSYEWTLTLGGEGDDRGECIWSDDSGRLLVGGLFNNTVDLDPTDGVDMRTAATSEGGLLSDMFVIRLQVGEGADGGTGDTGTGDTGDGSESGGGTVVPPVAPACAAGVEQAVLLGVFTMLAVLVIRRRI